MLSAFRLGLIIPSLRFHSVLSDGQQSPSSQPNISASGIRPPFSSLVLGQKTFRPLNHPVEHDTPVLFWRSHQIQVSVTILNGRVPMNLARYKLDSDYYQSISSKYKWLLVIESNYFLNP